MRWAPKCSRRELHDLFCRFVEWFCTKYPIFIQYLLSWYSGICWVITEDIFLIYLLIPIRMHHRKNWSILLGTRKRYSTDISEKCHVSGQKDKHNLWYLKYLVLNENMIVCKKAFNKTAKNITQWSSRTFGRSPHFIKAIFVYIILYSLDVLWYTSLQEFLATNLY